MKDLTNKEIDACTKTAPLQAQISRSLYREFLAQPRPENAKSPHVLKKLRCQARIKLISVGRKKETL
jgi:hypothetical protein